MSQPLKPCPSCQRHVFTDACACPFCATTLRVCEATRAAVGPVPHLGRAARLAAGAALMAAAACGSSAIPAYGAPPDASRDVPTDASGVDAEGGRGGNGADAGGAGGMSSPPDAGGDRVVVPLYGAAAPVPRKPVP